MTEGTLMPRKRSKLLRALKIGFFLALAAWGISILTFPLARVTVEVIANALRPGGTVAAWLVGVPDNPYSAAGTLLLATEFVADWIFYSVLALVATALIDVFRRNGAGQAV